MKPISSHRSEVQIDNNKLKVCILPVPYDVLGGHPYVVDGQFMRRPYLSDGYEVMIIGYQCL